MSCQGPPDRAPLVCRLAQWAQLPMDGEVEGCVVSVTKYIIVNSCHNSNKKLADEDTALDPKCEMEKIE